MKTLVVFLFPSKPSHNPGEGPFHCDHSEIGKYTAMAEETVFEIFFPKAFLPTIFSPGPIKFYQYDNFIFIFSFFLDSEPFLHIS